MTIHDMSNPPNVGTINLYGDVASYDAHLPLRPRRARPEGQSPDIASVAVGHLYIGVGAYNNPPLPPEGEPDYLQGAWLPIVVESKNVGQQPATIVVPYSTVFGRKRPPAYKQLLLVKGVKGAVIAPPSSDCVEVLRSNGEVLLLVNQGCTFQVTANSGKAHTVWVADGAVHTVLAAEPYVTADTGEFDVGQLVQTYHHKPKPPPAPVEPDYSVDFEYWKRLSMSDDWFAENSPDKDWLELLCTTLKSMYPRWHKRVAHVYPEPPHGGICIPLTAATYQSPTYGSQWAIDSQYFAGYYDGCNINAELAAGAMPASRLLMRCIYEIYWLSKAAKSEHPEEGSVLLTVPSLLN